MHARGAVPRVSDEEMLHEGLRVRAQVVCHHPFGIGLFVEAHDQYGHVDVPQITDGRIDGPEDYPPIGTEVDARVLAYSAGRQLRLRLRVDRT